MEVVRWLKNLRGCRWPSITWWIAPTMALELASVLTRNSASGIGWKRRVASARRFLVWAKADVIDSFHFSCQGTPARASVRGRITAANIQEEAAIEINQSQKVVEGTSLSAGAWNAALPLLFRGEDWCLLLRCGGREIRVRRHQIHTCWLWVPGRNVGGCGTTASNCARAAWLMTRRPIRRQCTQTPLSADSWHCPSASETFAPRFWVRKASAWIWRVRRAWRSLFSGHLPHVRGPGDSLSWGRFSKISCNWRSRECAESGRHRGKYARWGSVNPCRDERCHPS